MPLPTIPSGNVASATAGGFEVANSCRFNDGDSPQLHRNQPGSPTNGKIFTFSCWFKLGSSTSQITLSSSFQASGSIYDQIKIMAKATHNQVLRIEATSVEGNGIDLKASQSLRDPTAWYHLVLAVDTTQGTAGNRDKVYLNGTQITSWQTETHSTEDDTWLMNASGKTIKVGVYDNGTPQDFFDGYLAEVCLVDGQQLAPTSFGEFDEDSPTIWKPINVSGLTFGNNGFYLDFEDSGTLGNDVAGKGDFTAVNLAAADQSQDSPTNNFCVMNPLDNYYYDSDFSQGNTVIYTNGGAVYTFNTATFLLSAGRWYWEVKVAAGTNGTGTSYICGISDAPTTATSQELGNEGTQWGYYGAGHIRHNNGNDGSYTTYTAGDIVGVYLDLEDNKLYFTKNGTLENSGTGVSITAVTNSAIRNGGYFPATGYFDGDASGNAAYFYHNFGNGEFNGTAVSSSVADDNGYGLFEYSPNITGDGSAKKFYALCTKNLAEFG
jgi:hypothetical protein